MRTLLKTHPNLALLVHVLIFTTFLVLMCVAAALGGGWGTAGGLVWGLNALLHWPYVVKAYRNT